MSHDLKSPYPWFGGKSRVSTQIWNAFGNVENYVEPFFGSGAVLLSRPGFNAADPPTETINDKDGFVSNFWRALKMDCERVAFWADNPVNETDLHARHAWLVARRDRLNYLLEGDPDYYDAKIAGWWVWGICSWIGSGFCSGVGPWELQGVELINRQRPHLGDKGRGINRQLPHLGDKGRGINRQLPHLGNKGQGINEYLATLSERIRNVRVCSGDWSRVIGPSVTIKHGVTAVFLDPPYAVSDRAECYAEESFQVANEVREWAQKNGNNDLLRIVLAGYNEHDKLEEYGWRRENWSTSGGFGSQSNKDSQGKKNKDRETLWFSPHCIDLQPELF